MKWFAKRQLGKGTWSLVGVMALALIDGHAVGQYQLEKLLATDGALTVIECGMKPMRVNPAWLDQAVKFKLAGSFEDAEIVLEFSSESSPARLTGDWTIDGRLLIRSSESLTIAPEGSIAADSISIAAPECRLDGVLTATRGAIRIEADTLHVSGELRASTPPGCMILLGDRITLTGAALDASATGGGGTIIVGGVANEAGEYRSAAQTLIDRNTVILSDAIGTGDGGRVDIWSTKRTVFDGTISARGGAGGGDGGTVEVSGQADLKVRGLIDITAPAGAPGRVTFDPGTINVGNFAFPASGDDFVADGTVLANEPDTVTNIDISHTALLAIAGPIFLESTNDTIFNDPLSLTAGDLTVSALSGVVDMQSDLNIAFDLTLIAGQILFGGSVNTGSGNLTLDGPVDFDGAFNQTASAAGVLAMNGTVTKDIFDLTLSGSLIELEGDVSVLAGNLTLQGDVDLLSLAPAQAINLPLFLNIQGALTKNTPGDLLLDTPFADLDGDVMVTGGNLDVAGILDIFGTTFVAGDLNVAGGAVLGDDVNVLGAMTIPSGVNFLGNITTVGGSVDVGILAFIGPSDQQFAANSLTITNTLSSNNILKNTPGHLTLDIVGAVDLVDQDISVFAGDLILANGTYSVSAPIFETVSFSAGSPSTLSLQGGTTVNVQGIDHRLNLIADVVDMQPGSSLTISTSSKVIINSVTALDLLGTVSLGLNAFLHSTADVMLVDTLLQSGALLASDGTILNGGMLTSYAGTLAPVGLFTNAATAQLYGGIVDAPAGIVNTGQLEGYGDLFGPTTNDGIVVIQADMQIVGDYTNNDTTTIQNGTLTIVGTLVNNGTIIGEFASPAAVAMKSAAAESGMFVEGDYIASAVSSLLMASADATFRAGRAFDVAIDDSARFHMSLATLQMAGLAGQTLERMSDDIGVDSDGLDRSFPGHYPIGTLRIGPTPTTVTLVDNHDNDNLGQVQCEAIYVRNLIIDAGATLNTNGCPVYYETLVLNGLVDDPLNLIALPLCLADINDDNSVNVTDLLSLLAAWGPNPGHAADINTDGNVNVTDLLALLAGWGACP